MATQSGRLVVGEAKRLSVDVEQVYSVHIFVDGQPYGIVVAEYTLPNGIRCLTGHEFLKVFLPEQNFYREVGEAIARARAD